MTKGVFITGTDTGVGKTTVAVGLVRLLRARGIDVGVMKPVATGARRMGGRLVSEDARLLIKASATKDPYELVNPVCLSTPAAPSVASLKEGRPVRPGHILTAFRTLKSSHQFLVVEGIGGLLVPIDGSLFLSDIAKKMALPLIIVAKTSLGTINHTLLTVEAARRRGLKVLGIVLNSSEKRSADYRVRSTGFQDPESKRLFDYTRKEIERLSGVPILTVIPHAPNLKGSGQAPKGGELSHRRAVIRALEPVLDLLLR